MFEILRKESQKDWKAKKVIFYAVIVNYYLILAPRILSGLSGRRHVERFKSSLLFP